MTEEQKAALDSAIVTLERLYGRGGEANELRALLAASAPTPSVENTYRNALDEIVKNDPYNQSSAGVIARRALATPSDKQEAVAEVGEDAVFFLRKQPDGSRWPRGTKLYAAPLAQSAE